MKRMHNNTIAIITAAALIAASGLFLPAHTSLYAQDALTPQKSDGLVTPDAAAQKKPDAVKAEEPKKEEKKKDTPKKKESPRTFALNFKDSEIGDFLNFMSRLIGKNIIMDDNVRGKITIISNKEVPVSEAFEVTKAILEVKGLAIVETNNLLKVLPIRDAIKKNVDIVVDGDKKINADVQKTVTYLFELQNAEAAPIAQVLQPLKSQFTDIVVYPTLNTIIFSGSSTEIEGLLKISRALDRVPEKSSDGKAPKGNIHVIQLEFANAEELANVLSRVPFSEVAFLNTEDPAVRQSAAAGRVAGQPGAQPVPQKTKLSIIASKEANALIITANPQEFQEINKLIKQLDVVREQVLIESLIVEVSADNGWSYGIDWMLGNKVGSNMFGGSQVLSGKIPDYSAPGGLDKTLALPIAAGFQLGYLADRSILSYALLNASKSDQNFNILSTPQILTTDNQEAEINVGQQIPIPSQSNSTTSGSTTYSYDYKSVGVKLKVTPHITANDRILLDMYMEMNSILGDTQILGTSIIPPKLGKRDIKTRVSVMDAKTIVVGGLITNDKSVTETKIPLLGDIPILGWLFTRQSVQYKKTNLLVFITPHLLTKPEKMDILTQQKKEEQKLLKKD